MRHRYQQCPLTNRDMNKDSQSRRPLLLLTAPACGHRESVCVCVWNFPIRNKPHAKNTLTVTDFRNGASFKFATHWQTSEVQVGANLVAVVRRRSVNANTDCKDLTEDNNAPQARRQHVARKVPEPKDGAHFSITSPSWTIWISQHRCEILQYTLGSKCDVGAGT